MYDSRSKQVKAHLVATLLGFLFYASSLQAQEETPIPLASSFRIHSQVLDEERTIVVALPAGYEVGSVSYPVLYLLDGVQNLSHVVGSVDVLTRTGAMPPVIIVGVKSENRMRDFTPSSVEGAPYSGGGQKFLDFLRTELIPYIDAQYRTHSYRLLEGHSLAGLFVASTFMERPQLFDAYIVMSPALWWNNEEMKGRANSFFAANAELDKAIYFGIGASDGLGMRNELGRFVEALKQHQPHNLRWDYREIEQEGHMSAPLLINYYGLKFVFADMQLPEQLLQHFDEQEFAAHERVMMETYGEAAKQSEENYVNLGLKLMREENYEGAIAVFKRNSEAYPIYPPNFAWLADAYEKKADFSLALETYSLALEKSKAISFGQEQSYIENIDRLSKVVADGQKN